MNETIILTSENIHALGTGGVGFTHKQMKLLGVPLPAKSGWLKRLIGTEISVFAYQEAMLLRKDKQNQSNAKESGKESKPQQMSDDEIKALCERMDKKIKKMKEDDYRKRRQLLLAQKAKTIELPKMYSRIHRAKDWYGF